MTCYICTCDGLFAKWFPDEGLTRERVQAAAEAAADYFKTVDIDTEFKPDRRFWLECPVDRPYLFLATAQYVGHEEQLRRGADVLLDTLFEKR